MITVAILSVVVALGYLGFKASGLSHPYTLYPELVRELKPGGNEQRAVEIVKANPQLARSPIQIVHWNILPRTIRSSYTPLLVAAQHGRLEATRALIEAGADVNHRTHSGVTALKLAVSAPQHSGAMTRLLLEAGAQLGTEGRSLVYRAVLKGEPEAVRLLIDRGVDVNTPVTHGTFLGVALTTGRTDLVPVLLELGGTAPESAVMQARAWGKDETVNLYRQLTEGRR